MSAGSGTIPSSDIKIALDVLIVNCVCSIGKHYPLEFLWFQKREQCEACGEPFQNHTELCCQLIDWVCAHEIPGTFTFDSYFTCVEVLNHILLQCLIARHSSRSARRKEPCSPPCAGVASTTRQADGALPFCRVGQIADFPKTARAYIDTIAELIELPVTIVSIGPDREQTVFVGGMW